MSLTGWAAAGELAPRHPLLSSISMSAAAGGLDEECELVWTFALRVVAHPLPDADLRVRERGRDTVAVSEWDEAVAVAPQCPHRPLVIDLSSVERAGREPRCRDRLVGALCARRPAYAFLRSRATSSESGRCPLPTTAMYTPKAVTGFCSASGRPCGPRCVFPAGGWPRPRGCAQNRRAPSARARSHRRAAVLLAGWQPRRRANVLRA